MGGRGSPAPHKGLGTYRHRREHHPSFTDRFHTNRFHTNRFHTDRFHTDRFHTNRFHTNRLHTDRFHTDRFHTDRFHTNVEGSPAPHKGLGRYQHRREHHPSPPRGGGAAQPPIRGWAHTNTGANITPAPHGGAGQPGPP